MVTEAAAGPSQEEEARQASVQELQNLRDSLSQAETKTRELEGQLENINKVKHHKFQPKPFDLTVHFVVRQDYLSCTLISLQDHIDCIVNSFWPTTGGYRA